MTSSWLATSRWAFSHSRSIERFFTENSNRIRLRSAYFSTPSPKSSRNFLVVITIRLIHVVKIIFRSEFADEWPWAITTKLNLSFSAKRTYSFSAKRTYGVRSFIIIFLKSVKNNINIKCNNERPDPCFLSYLALVLFSVSQFDFKKYDIKRPDPAIFVYGLKRCHLAVENYLRTTRSCAPLGQVHHRSNLDHFGSSCQPSWNKSRSVPRFVDIDEDISRLLPHISLTLFDWHLWG